MKTMFFNTLMLAAIAVAGIFFAAPQSAQALDVPYGYTVQTEDMPPESGEVKRIKIFNTKKVLVSIIIQHRDGKNETQTLRDDGKVKSKYVTKGDLRLEFSYYPDGKLMRETRNGVLRFERRKLSDGTYEAIRYKEDGKRPQMLRRVGTKGEFELTHYRTDSHKPWFTVNIPGASGHFEQQYFAEDGSRLRRVLNSTDKTMIVTAYDKNGDYRCEQVWKQGDKNVYTLSSVTTRHSNQQRRYVLDTDGKTVKSVEDLNPDGEVDFTWDPVSVDPPSADLLKELFEDDDPTIPEAEEE